MGKSKGLETASTWASKTGKAKPAEAIQVEELVLAYFCKVKKPFIMEDKEKKKRLRQILKQMGCGNLMDLPSLL
jgi:hypothetical protein